MTAHLSIVEPKSGAQSFRPTKGYYIKFKNLDFEHHLFLHKSQKTWAISEIKTGKCVIGNVHKFRTPSECLIVGYTFINKNRKVITEIIDRCKNPSPTYLEWQKNGGKMPAIILF